MARTKSAITLSAAIQGHLRHVASIYSPATLADYTSTHGRFLEHCGDKPLNQITSSCVEEFLIHMRTTPIAPAGVTAATHQPAQPRYRRPKTIANLHIGLSALWTWAVERGYAKTHIVQAVPRPKTYHEPVIPLTDAEIVALIRACTESRPYRTNPFTRNYRPSAERDKALVAVLVETAVRVSELCALRYRDLTFARGGGRLYIDLGKGGKSRVAPFSRRCAGMLNDYLLTRPDIEAADPLFTNVMRNAGLPLTRGSVQQLLSRLGRKAGVDGVTPQRLRITAACLMVSNGISAWQLKEIMGHADVKTTLRYVRAASIDLDAAMKRASPMDNLRL